MYGKRQGGLKRKKEKMEPRREVSWSGRCFKRSGETEFRKWHRRLRWKRRPQVFRWLKTWYKKKSKKIFRFFPFSARSRCLEAQRGSFLMWATKHTGLFLGGQFHNSYTLPYWTAVAPRVNFGEDIQRRLIHTDKQERSVQFCCSNPCTLFYSNTAIHQSGPTSAEPTE